ncbi:MAG TPA: hypothetical protein VJ742_12105 [Nitrososphaera sp.]|nr:hypothetical protein [Nitrososphaera sp.]
MSTEERDWDQEFSNIVENLELSSPEIVISLEDICNVITSMTEASSFLAKFVRLYLEDETLEFPDELTNVLAQTQVLSDSISDKMYESFRESCSCDQCTTEAIIEEEENEE